MTARPGPAAIDTRRIPHAIRAAVEAAGIMFEQLGRAPLAIRPAEGGVEVLEDGELLVTVPWFRVACVDREMLDAHITSSASVADADQYRAAVAEGCTVEAPDSDYVSIVAGTGRVWLVHRSLVVPGWEWE